MVYIARLAEELLRTARHPGVKEQGMKLIMTTVTEVSDEKEAAAEYNAVSEN